MSNGRTVRASVILCLLSGIWVLRVEAATQNLINGVHVTQDGRDTVVEIASQRAPNFTTFKQDVPRRVIVDVAECDLTGVPASIRGDGRLVEGISTAHFGNEPHGISRVVIGLLKDAEYRVTIRGGSLFVHISEGTGGLLVSAGVPTAPPRKVTASSSAYNTQTNDPRDLALAEELAPPRPVNAGEPASEPGVDPEPAEKSIPTADEASPKVAIEVPPEPQEKPAAPKPVVGSEPALTKVAMASKTVEPTRVESAEAGTPAAPSTDVAQEDDTGSASGEGDEVEEVEEVEEVPVEVVDEPAAAGEAAPPPPPEEETAPPPPPEEEIAPPPPPPEEEVVPPPPPEEIAPREERVEISSAMKNMTWVGFQQTRDASRVYVKTNEQVSYRVTEESDNLIVLELENTRIPLRNNRRFLDTHFFDSAVTMITPHEIEGVTRSVRIEIQLKNRVPYKTVQEENMVYVNFERPQ